MLLTLSQKETFNDLKVSRQVRLGLISFCLIFSSSFFFTWTFHYWSKLPEHMVDLSCSEPHVCIYGFFFLLSRLHLQGLQCPLVAIMTCCTPQCILYLCSNCVACASQVRLCLSIGISELGTHQNSSERKRIWL